MIAAGNVRKIGLQAIDLDGHYLIEASAGTGKTTALCLLYLRLLFEKKLLPEQILTVTFTNAATTELKARIYAKLQKIKAWVHGAPVPLDDTDPDLQDKSSIKPHLAKVLQGFDRAAIYTIHGFCRKVLAEAALETGCHFSQNLIEDDKALLQPMLDDFWRKWLLPKGAKLAQQYQSIADYANVMALSMLGLKSKDQIEDFLNVLKEKGLPVPEELNTLLEQVKEKNYAAIDAPTQLLAPVKSLLSYPQDRLQFGKDPRGQFWKCLDDFCRKESRKRQDQKQEMGFHDLLLNVYEVLISEHGQHLIDALGNRYPAMLVDEFQDTDLLQYQIFKKMQDKITTSFFVGDPKQAIYGFRGADIFAYLEAKKAIQTNHLLSLDQNFRSSVALMQSINTLFTMRKNRPFVIPGIDYIPLQAHRTGGIRFKGREKDEPALLFLWLGHEQDIAPASSKGPADGPKPITKGSALQRAIAATVDRIAILLAKGQLPKGQDKALEDISAEDIAILVESHTDAKAMAEALAARHIPVILSKQDNVFTTAEAFDFWLVLSALLKPEWSLVHAALGTSFFGTPDNPPKLGNEKWLEREVERFMNRQLVWQQQGFAAMFAAFMADEQVDANLLAYADGKRRLANLLQLADLLQEESQSGKGMEDMLSWYAERLENAPHEESERFWLRTLEKEGKVRILTIHAAKGLEFPIVFCPFAWRRTPFSSNSSEMLRLLHPEGEHTMIAVDGNDEKRAQQEKQSELVRLLYVAITRAQYACHVVVGPVISAKKNKKDTQNDDHIGNTALGWLLAHDGAQLSWVDFGARLKDLCEQIEQNGGSAEIRTSSWMDACQNHLWPTEDPLQNTPVNFQARTFSRGDKIAKTFAMTSFSAMAQHRRFIEEPDYDEFLPTPGEEVAIPPKDFSDIAHFPKGAKTGECWHLIFEAIAKGTIDAKSNDFLPYIKETLEKFALPNDWSNALCALVHKVLAFNLQGFSLADVMPSSLAEFEFIFAINPQTLAKLPCLLAQHRMPEPFVQAASHLSFEDLSGFLKGFIDLVFRAPNGKYYLLDYKSTWLGFNPKDYASENLIAAMAKHHYYLQYLIYTVALHRFLKSRNRAYDDFGGVFYLFLRGMVHQQGVYFDRPHAELVQELDQWLGPPPSKTPKNPISVAMS